MLRATRVIAAAERAGRPSVDSVSLTRAERYRRRIVMRTIGGRQFLLDLPEATYLAGGDALVLEDGGHIAVEAAAEDLIEIRAPDGAALARLAWHIGNRHTPCEVTGSALYIEADHVLEDMVRRLGGVTQRVARPFDPERGAYARGHAHPASEDALEHRHHDEARPQTHHHGHTAGTSDGG
jgi:urease accessory protein